MLECIRQIYERNKSDLISLQGQEIADQKAKADIDLITPKFQEYEQNKAQQIAYAQEQCNKSIATANESCESQKLAYRTETYKKIETAVNAQFATALADLDKKLANE